MCRRFEIMFLTLTMVLVLGLSWPGFVLGQAVEPQEPIRKTRSTAVLRQENARVITGYGRDIIVTTKTDAEIDLLDENDGAIYSTDAKQLDRQLFRLRDGTLHYKTERGDRVMLLPSGDRTTFIDQQKFQIRETIKEGRRTTRDFGFEDGPLKGRWVFAGNNQYQHHLDKRIFHGRVELVDVKSGEYRVTNFELLKRDTYRRDGYHKAEVLSASVGQATSYEERLADGSRVEWSLLSPAELVALEQEIRRTAAALAEEAGTEVVALTKNIARAESFRITTPQGNVTKLIEVIDGQLRYLVRAEAGDGNDWLRRGRTEIWDRPYRPDRETAVFFGSMERVGRATLKYANVRDHQVVTLHPNGTVIQEFLEEQTLPNSDLQFESVERPQYTLTFEAGQVRLLDWLRRRRLTTDAVAEQDRLHLNPETGDLSFFEPGESGRKITIHQDGRRRLEQNRGLGSGVDLDVGGRMKREFSDDKTLADYAYSYTKNYQQPVGLPLYLSSFQNESGSWAVTNLPNGRQRWQLTNGVSGTIALAADLVQLDRHNSFILEYEGTRTIRVLDGTEIRISKTSDVATQTRITWVGTRDNSGEDAKEAYSISNVTTHAGVPIRDEMKSKAGLFVRGGNGTGYDQSPWCEIDADGKPRFDSVFYGHICVNEQGTLVKQTFRTEPDPERVGQSRIMYVHDAGGKKRPEIDNTFQLFTSGHSEQRFSHGGIVYRDGEGDVQWIETPTGEVFRIEYIKDETEDSTKQIARVETGGRIWTYADDKGRFHSDGYTALHPGVRGSFTNIDVNSLSAIVKLTNIAPWDDPEWDVTFQDVDGSIRLDKADGTKFHTRGDGRLTRLVDDWKIELILEYASDGRLVRVDFADVPYDRKLSYTDKDYIAPSDRPLYSKVVVGTELELRGWGLEKYVSYVNSHGLLVRHWPDGVIEQRDRSTDVIVSIQSYDGFKVQRADSTLVPQVDQEELPPDQLELAQSVDPVSGNRFDRLISFTDAAGRRVERSVIGEIRRYDEQGRLASSNDRSNRFKTFEYASIDEKQPIRILGHNFQLNRDGETGQATKTSFAGDGKQMTVVAIRDFWLEPNGDILVEHTMKPQAHVRYEVLQARGGGRVEISSDATRTAFDELDRVTSREDATRKISWYGYERESSEPVTQHTIEAFEKYPPQPSSVEFQVKDETPQGLTRTTKDASGTDVIFTVTQRADDMWIDTLGGEFDSLWFASDKSAAYMSADRGRVWSVMYADGTEIGFRLSADYQVQSRVFRNVLGETTNVIDSDLRSTFFGRNQDGEITVLSQENGKYGMFKVKDPLDTWELSCEPGISLLGMIAVDRDGTQQWTSPSGAARIVYADGTVDVTAPNHSRQIFPRDQSHTRYIYASGNDVSEATHYKNGDVEILFDNGEFWRRDSYSNVIETSARQYGSLRHESESAKPIRGSLSISPNGLTTLYNDETRAVDIFYPDGRTTQLVWSQDYGWQDVDTQRVYEDPRQLGWYLTSINAMPIKTADNSFAMSDAFEYRPSLFLAMHVLYDENASSNPRQAAPQVPQQSPASSSPAEVDLRSETPLASADENKPMEQATPPDDLASLPTAVVILVQPAMDGDPVAQFELGKWYYQEGKLAKAKEWLTKSAVIFPPANRILTEVEEKIRAK